MTTVMHAELDGSPHAARAARQLVRRLLGENHPLVNDATLVVSELVGNAVAHTRSGQPGGALTLVVEVSARPPSMHIRVRDAGSPVAPVLTAASPRSEHGRGLAIIAALAADWGSEPSGTGRSTWCRLTPGTHPAATRSPARPEHEQPASRADATRRLARASTKPEAVPGEAAGTSDRTAPFPAQARGQRRNPPNRTPEAVATRPVIRSQARRACGPTPPWPLSASLAKPMPR